MKAKVLAIESDGDNVALVLRLPDGMVINSGDFLYRSTLGPNCTTEMATGEYVGHEEQFQGRRALLRLYKGGVLLAQFNEGEIWETHSWLTFDESEWSFDLTQTIL